MPKGITQLAKDKKMSAKKNTVKPVKITAPKITTAWIKVCSTSGKAEAEVIASIENLSAVLVLESGLSVADMKKVIKETGKESAFIKASHVPALPTWSKLRALNECFKALPIAKQLSTAMASYDLLGAGQGEQIKPSVNAEGEPVSATENLQKAIASVRKAKQSQTPKPASDKPAKKAATIQDTLRAAINLVNSIGDGVEEDIYDLLLELAEAAALKVGADA